MTLPTAITYNSLHLINVDVDNIDFRTSYRAIIKLGNGSSSGAIVGPSGTIFVPTMNHYGEVKAIAPNGTLLWRYQVFNRLHNTTSRVQTTPALSSDGSTLYIADAFYYVIALNAHTGQQVKRV